MKNSCISNWNCKNSHIVEAEWASLFILYLINFSVVIVHPVFQLYLSVTQISAHCVLVMCSYIVNGLKCAQILILVSKIYICDMCCMHFKNSSFTKHLLPSYCFWRIFLVCPIFLLILLNWFVWKIWIPCNIWKSDSGTS